MRVLSETRLSFDEAAVRMKKTRRTIGRWSTAGYAGEVLESAFIGLMGYTSVEALDRFVTAMNRQTVSA